MLPSEQVKVGFGTIDTVIFVATLIIAALIGVYFAVKDRRKKDVDNYFYGGRKMSPVPLGFSIAVSFISAITIIGFPADSYVYGMVTITYSLTLIYPTIVACLYYIPLMHRLRLVTSYEYLELRFHPAIRKVASASECLNALMYMGSIVYLPALALNAVTPIPLEWSIIATSIVCTLYTTLGGLKAVVWTDTFQAGIMLIGALALLIQSTIHVGGFGNVWAALERGQRDNILVLDIDPRIRTTTWGILIGFSTTQCITACCNQSICQRYMSCKSVTNARIAACVALIIKIIITVISIISGCVAYAYFEGCDPLKEKVIQKSDQMMPYLALEAFQNLPGLSGFFVAAAYSGTLSSVSSGINSVGAMLLEDFILPVRPNMTNAHQLLFSKVTAVLLGCLVTGIAFLLSITSDTVISVTIAFRGAFGGPMLGIFTLGIFLPWCNSIGAFSGQIIGLVFSAWLTLGGLIHGKPEKWQRRLPTSIDNCTNPMTTASVNDVYNWTASSTPHTPSDIWTSSVLDAGHDETSIGQVYAISFMYYTVIGLLVTLVTGMLISACTGFRDPKKSDPKLFMPLFDNPHLPAAVRRFFRFGVPELGTSELHSEGKPEELVQFQGSATSLDSSSKRNGKKEQLF